MIFSKSFGYAVRGVLYIAFTRHETAYVQVSEIASALGVPRHFMGKVLKKLAKEKVLNSTKGPSGGFAINQNTRITSLFRLAEITTDLGVLHTCVLQIKECNGNNPCPLHHQVVGLRNNLASILSNTTVADMLSRAEPDFIQSISAQNDIREIIKAF
jgi:Rrf2 family iron-sulfur cluster assembly transcriptional regulator